MVGWPEEGKPGPQEADRSAGEVQHLTGAEERGCFSRGHEGGAWEAEGPQRHLWKNLGDCWTLSGAQQGLGSMHGRS